MKKKGERGEICERKVGRGRSCFLNSFGRWLGGKSGGKGG
ncbi:hypothetical protein FKM95_000043 [Candidatus Tremblaya phenacola]|nr:hypothetical protein FKM95_000043 [Candidatus Tremblaya phenacola]